MKTNAHVNWLLAGPVLVAVVVRVVGLLLFQGSVLFEPLALSGHDRTLYHAAMGAVSRGVFFPVRAFEFLPLYAWVTGTIGMVTGPSLIMAAVFGIACDAATTLLIVLMAQRLGAGRGWAGAAGFFYAVYPLAVIYSLLTMPNTLNTLGVTLFVYAAMRLEKPTLLKAALLGLLAGVFTLGFAGMILIGLAVMGVIAWRARAWTALGVFILGMALPVAPVAIHNSRAEGQFVLLTTHGGFNFYMGNHEQATGYPVRVRDFRLTALDMLDDAHRYAEQQAGGSLTRAESSDWWKSEGLRFWREHPGQALLLTGKKVMLFWNHREMDDLRMLEQLKVADPAFRFLPGIPFAIFALLGLIGLFLPRQATVPRAALLAGMFGLAIFFITSRYRLPLVPVMAALGMAGLAESFRGGKYIRTAWLVLMMVVILFPFAARNQKPVDYYNVAVHLLNAGMEQQAQRVIAEGLEEAPDFAGLSSVRGMLLFKQENYAEAAAAFERSLELFPANGRDAYNLALCLARLERFCDARDRLVAARDAQVRLDDAALQLLRELENACKQNSSGASAK